MAQQSLYERDFYSWTQDQAEQLRTLRDNRLDAEHLAEEVADLGRGQLEKVIGNLRQCLVHLIKAAAQPESPHVYEWIGEAEERESEHGSYEYKRSYGAGIEYGGFFSGLDRWNQNVLEPNNGPTLGANALSSITLAVEASFLENTRLTAFAGFDSPFSSNPSISAIYGGLEPAFAFRSDMWELAIGLGVGAPLAALGTAALALAAVATGLAWSFGLDLGVAAFTGLVVHVYLGIFLVPVLLVHLLSRFHVPTRADFEGRRTAIQTALLVGGVAPVGHLNPLRIWIDPRLLDFDRIWAAAGTPHHVFAIAPGDLQRVTGGVLADFTADA